MKKYPILRWLPSIIMMVAIFVFSSIPSNSMPSFGLLDLLVKKASHMVGYGLLTLAIIFGFNNNEIASKKWAIMLAILYALTDEWHQSYVPGRNGSLWDVGIDALGSITSVYLFLKFNLFSKFKL